MVRPSTARVPCFAQGERSAEGAQSKDARPNSSDLRWRKDDLGRTRETTANGWGAGSTGRIAFCLR